MKFSKRIYSEAKGFPGYKITTLAILFLFTSQISAQTIKSSSTNTQAPTIFDLQLAQTDSFPEFFELSEENLNKIELYDPSKESQSIPEDVDWIFEVPVDVRNISPDVQEIMVMINVYNNDEEKISFGVTATKMDLVDGAYKGNLIIGVKYDWNKMEEKYGYHLAPNKAKRYSIGLFLKTGALVHYPVTVQANPPWRMADANQPFRAFIYGDLPEGYSSN